MLVFISAFYFLSWHNIRMLTFLCNLKGALSSKNWSTKIKGIVTRTKVPLVDFLREPKDPFDGDVKTVSPKLKGAHISWPRSCCCRPVCARASHQTPCPENNMAKEGAWVAKWEGLSTRETVDNILSREIPSIKKEKERKEVKWLQAWAAFHIW